MKAEQILADAEVAACYLRALVDKGVPLDAAVHLTASYVRSADSTVHVIAPDLSAPSAAVLAEFKRRAMRERVRGHFADYTEGGGLFGKLHGRYYIAPHVRGSAERGTVTKDYRVLAPA